MTRAVFGGVTYDVTEVGDSAGSALARYTAWADALGVSAIDSQRVLTGDDAAFRTTTGSGFLVDSMREVAIGTEGSVCFFIGPHNNSSVGLQTPYPARTYGIQPYESMLTFRGMANALDDQATTDGRVQVAGSVTIVYAALRNLGSDTNRTRYAWRMDGRAMQIVVEAVDIPAALNLLFSGRVNAMPELAYTAPVAAGSTREFAFAVSGTPVAAVPVPRVLPLAVRLFTKVPPKYSGARVFAPAGKAGTPYDIEGRTGRGIGWIRDTVKKKATPANLPLRRRVRLYRDRDGKLLRETWSDATTGAYAFEYLDELERVTVVAYDHEHGFGAAIADNLLPSVTP